MTKYLVGIGSKRNTGTATTGLLPLPLLKAMNQQAKPRVKRHESERENPSLRFEKVDVNIHNRNHNDHKYRGKELGLRRLLV
jgi:hypothetical protein